VTTSARHPLVEDYLHDLERCAARLPRHQRDELVEEVREHLDAGLTEATSDAEIRNLLDSLGTPDEIVEEAAPRSSMEGPTGQLALGFGIASLLLLIFGIYAIPFGVTAIVLGLRARRHRRTVGLPTSTSTGAIVTGACTVLIVVVVALALLAGRVTDSSDDGPSGGTPVPTTTGAG
jgi:uncharacterized membrane protein